MASLASSKKRNRVDSEKIKAGTIFYVKWNMEVGTERYFKAFATGKNKGGKFEIRYSQDGSTEMRKISTIDDRSETLISQEIYNTTKSAYPPKKTPVGEDHQVGELPSVGTNTNYERAKSMKPLTRRQILIDSVTPLTNREADEDMERAAKSQEGYGRKTRRRRKKKRRKSRKKRKTIRRKRKKRRSKKAGGGKRRSPVPSTKNRRNSK